MSHGYAITARALDANSPRSSFETLPPAIGAKNPNDRARWSDMGATIKPYGRLLCFGNPRGSESGATTLQKRVDFLEWFVLPALDFHSTPEAQGAR